MPYNLHVLVQLPRSLDRQRRPLPVADSQPRALTLPRGAFDPDDLVARGLLPEALR
jgi:hypothetical protein